MNLDGSTCIGMYVCMYLHTFIYLRMCVCVTSISLRSDHRRPQLVLILYFRSGTVLGRSFEPRNKKKTCTVSGLPPCHCFVSFSQMFSLNFSKHPHYHYVTSIVSTYWHSRAETLFLGNYSSSRYHTVFLSVRACGTERAATGALYEILCIWSLQRPYGCRTFG